MEKVPGRIYLLSSSCQSCQLTPWVSWGKQCRFYHRQVDVQLWGQCLPGFPWWLLISVEPFFPIAPDFEKYALWNYRITFLCPALVAGSVPSIVCMKHYVLRHSRAGGKETEMVILLYHLKIAWSLQWNENIILKLSLSFHDRSSCRAGERLRSTEQTALASLHHPSCLNTC